MQYSLSRFGVVEDVFSDNGPCFASAEYIQFRGLQKNNLIIAIPTIKWTSGKNHKNYLKKHTKEKQRPVVRITNPSEYPRGT